MNKKNIQEDQLKPIWYQVPLFEDSEIQLKSNIKGKEHGKTNENIGWKAG